MKKIICAILIIVVLLIAVGCSAPTIDADVTNQTNETSGNEKPTKSNDVDVDLTKLSSTMVYGEVYNMVTYPSQYLGKTVKMKGAFSVYSDPSTGHNYYACLIADATACCSQGIEFILAGDHRYPDDYPELGTDITVTGVFDTYYEGNYRYCQLIDAKMA